MAEIDLSAFLADYREDGWGRPAFDPEVMVALLLYAYAVGERSSRAIERGCREDSTFRVITANAVPDHATIARFRQRHERALAGVFTEVLRLCARPACSCSTSPCTQKHKSVRLKVDPSFFQHEPG